MGESSQEAVGAALSRREFARRIGVSDMAVRKAIKSGRLRLCLGKNAKGDTVIVNFELARREWERSSRTAAGVRTEGGSQGSQHVQESARPVQEPLREEEPSPDGVSMFEAQRQATLERARQLKLANDVTEGRLISIESVSKEVFEVNRIVRESVLNLPARMSGDLAAEGDAARVNIKLDAALREALDTAADHLSRYATAVNA